MKLKLKTPGRSMKFGLKEKQHFTYNTEYPTPMKDVNLKAQ
jgi:hypothetical protein